MNDQLKQFIEDNREAFDRENPVRRYLKVYRKNCRRLRKENVAGSWQPFAGPLC